MTTNTEYKFVETDMCWGSRL